MYRSPYAGILKFYKARKGCISMSMTVSNATITYPLSVVATTDFDYEDIPDDEVEALEASAESIRTTISEGQAVFTELVLTIGKQLLSAQECLANHGNGGFLKWCKEACGLNRSSVYNYLAAVRVAKDCPTVGQSSEVSALYVLGAESCPHEARTQATELVEGGEFITAARAKELVRNCGSAKKRPQAVTRLLAKSNTVDPAAVDAYTTIATCVNEIRDRSTDVTEIVAALRRIAAELETSQQHAVATDGIGGVTSASHTGGQVLKATSGKTTKQVALEIQRRVKERNARAS